MFFMVSREAMGLKRVLSGLSIALYRNIARVGQQLTFLTVNSQMCLSREDDDNNNQIVCARYEHYYTFDHIYSPGD